MEAMSVLKEFRQRRELLENLRVNAAKPRLKGMWDFLQKERETIKIISKIPPVDHLISKASPTKQIEAKAPDEVRAVGFYIMEECSKTNKRITEIVNHLGIISKDQKLKRQNYADNAMTGFVNPALDFVEEELVKLSKTKRKKKSTKRKQKITKKTSKRSATKQADNRQAKQVERIDGQDVSGEEGSEGGKVLDTNLDLRIAFEKYLVEKKNYTPENYSTLDISGEYAVTRIWDNEEKVLALMTFCLKRSGAGKAFEGIEEHKKTRGISGVPNYVIFANEDQKMRFAILKYEDDGTPHEMSHEDFPDYEDLRRQSEGDGGEAAVANNFSAEQYEMLRRWSDEDNIAKWNKWREEHPEDEVRLQGAQMAGWNLKGANLRKADLRVAYLSEVDLEGADLRGANLWHAYMPRAILRNALLGDAILGAAHIEDAEFEGAIWGDSKGMDEDMENPKQRGDVVGNVPTIRVEGIGEKDRLGRDKLVKTLAGMFAQTECDNGFTMALLGDWGQGKSTVMDLLKKELNGRHKGKFEFAKYNAWEYENAENIAAGMAQEVVSGIIDRTRFWKRQKLRFYFALVEYWKNICRVMLYIVFAVFLLGVVSYVGGESTLKDYGLATGWVALLIYVVVNIAKIIEHPISVKLETYLSLPNYRKHLGLVPVLRRHINTLCSLRLRQGEIRLKRGCLAKLWRLANRIANIRRKWLFILRLLGRAGKKLLRRWWLRVKGKPVRMRRLVLFVDDLDRCNVDHIVKVLDAIRLVMTIPNVIVMIGIDHRIAFQAIGKHYKELADGGDTRGAGEIARDYLGKIIQLPLRLRAASHGELKDYVFEKLFDKKSLVDDSKIIEESERKDGSEKPLEISPSDGIGVSDAAKAEQVTKDQSAEREVTEEEISEAIKDTKRERDEFYTLAGKYGFSNPRQLLRLHNSFRFLKGYGRGKGEGYDTLDMLRMLFWQEFLHNWPVNIRGICMAELIGEVHGEGVKPIVKRVLDKVRDDIVKLFNGENYAELAEFVRIVVLPHNEEGIFDTQEEIDEWLKKKVADEKNIKTTPKKKATKKKAKRKSVKKSKEKEEAV